MRLAYSVRVDHPTEHRAQFALHADGIEEPAFDVVFPSWVPGSYTFRPIARNVQGLRARGRPSGAPLAADRREKGRWRVEARGERSVDVEYSVYGHELITEALDVTEEHLFLNAALCLPYVDGHKEEPCEIEIAVRPAWTIVTELAQSARSPPRFRAANYDELVDSPIDCGRPLVVPMTARGRAHRISLCGVGGNFEVHRLEADLARIVEATAALFGELPSEPYTFFYHLTDRRDGGLEHRSSASMVIPRTAFRPESEYQGFLRLSSHEYFHRFNVKRIRPKVLGPFDYTKENYTRLLWAMEGTTDYYATLLIRRAGIVSPSKYLEGVAKDVLRYREIPGRLSKSLEEASMAAWVDLYQPYEETVNQSVSYYLKGALVSLCLDLDMRRRTQHRSRLDDVMRALWRDVGARAVGLAAEELLPVAERATGIDLKEFFG